MEEDENADLVFERSEGWSGIHLVQKEVNCHSWHGDRVQVATEIWKKMEHEKNDK